MYLVRVLRIYSPELVIRVGAANLCTRNHLFVIGGLELHGAATVRPSLVVVSLGKS
jgi:hypothetical protein